MQRIDVHPTHTFGEYKLRPGRPYPYGATFVPDGVNFAVFSRHATACTLVLFEKGNGEPLVEIPFPEEFRVGNVYTMIVFGLDAENIEYGFRMDGPCSPRQGH
jgi:isoamylase